MRQLFPASYRMTLMQSFIRSRSGHLEAIQLAFRAAISAALAVGIAKALGLQTPLFALIGAVIVTDLSPATSRQLALTRLAGTVLGGATGAILSGVLPAGPAGIGLGIAAAMLISHFLRLEGAARLTGYLCAIVILTQSDEPWSYALHRTLETMLGICIALAVSLVPLLISGGDRHQQRDPDKEKPDSLF